MFYFSLAEMIAIRSSDIDYPYPRTIKNDYNTRTLYTITSNTHYWPFIADEAIFKITKAWRRYKLFFQKIRLNKIKKIQRWWIEICYRPGGKLSLQLMEKSAKLLEEYVNKGEKI
jgi:hypothetical protein